MRRITNLKTEANTSNIDTEYDYKLCMLSHIICRIQFLTELLNNPYIFPTKIMKPRI